MLKQLSSTLFTGESRFSTEVPKPPVAFDWHHEPIRTICAKRRFRKT
jgi:hypothetical protein